jgi:Ca-activated chloride channel family protein
LFRRLLVVFLALACAPAALAQGFILPRPTPDFPRPPALTVRRHRVDVAIDSGAAKTHIEQVFGNPANRQMEGTYVFPLPESAAISNFRMLIDSEPVEGKMLDRDEARRIYESYVRRMVDPALLEYVGRNAFQARVFPIPANGEKQIELIYSQPLHFEGGVYQYTYPLNTEKFSNRPLDQVAVSVTIHSKQPIKAIYSPSHEVAVRRIDEYNARVSFEASSVRADKDFVLYYTVSEKEFGLSALAHRRGDEDGYFMLMLAPQRQMSKAQIAAKDVVFVFDTSGSMNGPKIEQAKRALQFVLNNLNPRDRFNIIQFSSEVEPFRKGLVDASEGEVTAARKFVEEIKAVGGTAIHDALITALESLPATRGDRPTMLVFVTDGLPTVGETSVDAILRDVEKQNKGRARIFAFGVGDDVNTLLLDHLARDGGGTVEYVRPSEDLELKVSAFYAKIASPVLSDLALDVNGITVTETYPRRLPDLFAGSQLIVFGRYRGGGAATAKLTGHIAGQTRTFSYPVTLPDREREHDFIPAMWASRKIGTLLEEIRLRGENAELKNEVIRLSKQYGIITPYTSFLVEEPGVNRPVQLLRESEARRDALLALPPGAPGPSGPVGSPGGGGFGGGSAGRAAGPRGPQGPPGQRRIEGLSSPALGSVTGSEAVKAAQAVQDLKNQSVAQSQRAVQQVNGQAFYQRGETWVDGRYEEKMPTITVKWGSEAYFQIVRQKPDLAKALAQGKSVVVVVAKNQALRVGDTGKETLTPADVRALGLKTE